MFATCLPNKHNLVPYQANGAGSTIQRVFQTTLLECVQSKQNEKILWSSCINSKTIKKVNLNFETPQEGSFSQSRVSFVNLKVSKLGMWQLKSKVPVSFKLYR